jgi:hypothetical protein
MSGSNSVLSSRVNKYRWLSQTKENVSTRRLFHYGRSPSFVVPKRKRNVNIATFAIATCIVVHVSLSVVVQNEVIFPVNESRSFIVPATVSVDVQNEGIFVWNQMAKTLFLFLLLCTSHI